MKQCFGLTVRSMEHVTAGTCILKRPSCGLVKILGKLRLNGHPDRSNHVNPAIVGDSRREPEAGGGAGSGPLREHAERPSGLLTLWTNGKAVAWSIY